MKIEIPKNLWLSSAELDFYREGLHKGSYGLTLNLTGQAIGGPELMIEVLEPLTQVQLPKRKIVRLRGLFNPKDPDLQLLVEAFRSWGFQVHGVIPVESLSLPWIRQLDWLIVTSSKPFIPLSCHELWYQPPQADEILEPRLPNPERTLLYLAKNYSTTQTTKFILNSKNNWALL